MAKFKEKVLIPILNGINKFFNSDWFIAFYSALVILSWAKECEYIAIISSIVILLYMFLTQENLDRMALVAIVIPAMVDANMGGRISLKFVVVIAVLVVAIVLAGVLFAIRHGKNSIRKITKSHFFGVYVLCVVALCFSGLGYPDNTIAKVLIPVGVHLALLGLYCLLYKFGGNNLKDTIIKSIIALAGVIVVEMLIYFSRHDNVLDLITTKVMTLGWAITNSVAVILALAVPLCFYLAKDKKIQLPYMLLGSLFYAFIFLTNCRSMILVGSVVYLITIVLSFIFLDRWQALAHLILFGCVAYIAVNMLYEKIFNQFLKMGLDDNGRMELWTYYLDEFKTNWFFGIGFYSDKLYQADGMVRAHNTIIQIIACMGVLGALCAIPYYFQRYVAFVIKPTVFKLFAFVAYIAMAGYGMLDCAVISSYKLIVVCMLMLAVEYDTLEYTPMPLSTTQWISGLFKRKKAVVVEPPIENETK